MDTDEWMAMMTSKEPLHPDLVPYLTKHESWGLGLKHPLVFSIPMGVPAMLNAQYAAKVKALAEARAEKNWFSVIWLHERPHRLDALLEIDPLLSDQEYWDLVGDIWVDSENIFQHIDDWTRLFASTRPGREVMMTEDEKAALAAMTEPITVYRGYNQVDDPDEESRVDGLSWTVDKERAIWFAKRFAHKGVGEVAVGTVAHQDVIAYFLRRGESEIVTSHIGAVYVTDYLSVDPEPGEVIS